MIPHECNNTCKNKGLTLTKEHFKPVREWGEWVLFISKIHLNVGLKKCFPYLPTRLWVWEREREREREGYVGVLWKRGTSTSLQDVSLSFGRKNWRNSLNES